MAKDTWGKLRGRRISRRTLLDRSFRAGIGAAGLALVGCGDDDDDDGGGQSLLERARSGNFRVGFAQEPPYGFASAEGATGEAPEVAREVLSRMGIDDWDAVVTTFGALIPGLTAGRFDMIAAGMFINPGRCEQVVFSDPDFCVPQALGVVAGNPLGLMNYEDIAANPDATVAVLAGAVEVGYLMNVGVSEDQMVTFDDTASMADALAAGRVDAFTVTTLSVRDQIERIGEGFETTPGFLAVDENGNEIRGCGGAAFRLSNQEFRDAYNAVLADMKANGEILPITEPFGFGEDEIGAAQDLTADDLCEA